MVKADVVQAETKDGILWGIAFWGNFYPFLSKGLAEQQVGSFIENQDRFTSVEATILWET